MDILADTIAAVHTKIITAAQRVGRSPSDVKLVVVTKTQPAYLIAKVLATGICHIGENRVQEAAPKIHELRATYPHVTWHLLGHLQRNKAKRAVTLFDVIQSLDSVRLAEELNQRIATTCSLDYRLPVLLQVNISGEMSKEGFDLSGGIQNPTQFACFIKDVEHILALPYLEVRGLMTIAPLVEHSEKVRPVFSNLRLLRDTLVHRFPNAQWYELSMGMSNDFEVAIEEGATIVRIGRAIFGARG